RVLPSHLGFEPTPSIVPPARRARAPATCVLPWPPVRFGPVERMKTNVLALAHGVVFVALFLATICRLALVAALVHLGFPARRIALFDLDAARNLLNLFSRAGNQLVGVVFTTVAIAVPLTANMYSLKFLEFFLKDRVNAAMLLLAATVALNTVVVGYALKATFVPMVTLHVQLALLSAGFVLLLPYLYYVFRF